MGAAVLVWPVWVSTPTFFPSNWESSVISLRVMTKDLGKSDVGIAMMTMSATVRRLRKTPACQQARSDVVACSKRLALGGGSAFAGLNYDSSRFLLLGH
jgi:hypothetical protein